MGESRKPTQDDVSSGRALAASRKAAGVTQQELAEYLKISAQQLSKYERGKNRMSKGRYDRAIAYLADGDMGTPAGFADAGQVAYAPPATSLDQLVAEIESARAALDRALKTAKLMTP